MLQMKTILEPKNFKIFHMPRINRANLLLKQAIEDSGVDVTTIAEMTGLVRPTLSTWVTGRTVFQPHKKAAHSDALDRIAKKLMLSKEVVAAILEASRTDSRTAWVAEASAPYDPDDRELAPILLAAIADPATSAKSKDAAIQSILRMLQIGPRR